MPVPNWTLDACPQLDRSPIGPMPVPNWTFPIGPYFNAVNNKTNEVMKTLTIISTIFIPLSFVAGVYGMNFQHMPGLGWKYGFGLLSLGMVAVGGAMLAWFHRRGWFS